MKRTEMGQNTAPTAASANRSAAARRSSEQRRCPWCRRGAALCWRTDQVSRISVLTCRFCLREAAQSTRPAAPGSRQEPAPQPPAGPGADQEGRLLDLVGAALRFLRHRPDCRVSCQIRATDLPASGTSCTCGMSDAAADALRALQKLRARIARQA